MSGLTLVHPVNTRRLAFSCIKIYCPFRCRCLAVRCLLIFCLFYKVKSLNHWNNTNHTENETLRQKQKELHLKIHLIFKYAEEDVCRNKHPLHVKGEFYIELFQAHIYYSTLLSLMQAFFIFSFFLFLLFSLHSYRECLILNVLSA